MTTNRNGGGHRTGPQFNQQATVPLDDELYGYLAKMQRIRGGSLAEELRRCIRQCMAADDVTA